MKTAYGISIAIFIAILIILFVIFGSKNDDDSTDVIQCGEGLTRRSFPKDQQLEITEAAAANGITVTFNESGEIQYDGSDTFWEWWDGPYDNDNNPTYANLAYLCKCDNGEGFKLKKKVEKFQRISSSGGDINTCCGVSINEDGTCNTCSYCNVLDSNGLCIPTTDANEVTGSCIAYNIPRIGDQWVSGGCGSPIEGDSACARTANPFRCIADDSDISQTNETCMPLFTQIWDGGVVSNEIDPSTGDIEVIQDIFDECNNVSGCSMDIDWDKWPRVCADPNDINTNAPILPTPSEISDQYPMPSGSRSNLNIAVEQCRSRCNAVDGCNSFTVKARTLNLNGWYCDLHNAVDPPLKEYGNGAAYGWNTGCFKK